jgi:hypothetical protein
VPIDGSIGIGVAAPDESESLYELRVLCFELIVLLAMLKMFPPLNRRSADRAEFMVPTDDWLAAMEADLAPLDR